MSVLAAPVVLQLTEAALHGAVATLLRREIIERVADAYRITVPLVEAYVRSRILL